MLKDFFPFDLSSPATTLRGPAPNDLDKSHRTDIN